MNIMHSMYMMNIDNPNRDEIPEPTTIRQCNCPVCDKLVNVDALNGHMYIVHKAKPASDTQTKRVSGSVGVVRDASIRYQNKSRLFLRNKLDAEQPDGLCVLCNRPETVLGRDGMPRKLSIDHNHETGIVRQALCQRCNFVVGGVERIPASERQAYAQRLVEYLEFWDKNS